MKKNITRFIQTLLLLIIFSNNAFSQGQSTTQGNDFWLSFGQNAGFAASNVTLQIRIVTIKATSVTITFTADNSNETFDVAAGQVYTRTFTAAEAAKIYSDATGTSGKSLHIVSDQDITVFAINLYRASTDATNVLPVSNYGQAYRHITYKHLAGTGLGDGYILVASEDNTTISENGTGVATLNKGQVYSKYTSGGDLTGTLITSDQPIAYFTANTCVQVPTGTTACDCLFQQQAPVHSWGNKFLVPVTKRGIERIRIVASQDGTAITQTGGTVITVDKDGNALGTGSLSLNAGQFVELQIALSGGGCHIVSDKPVAVASFLTGTSFSGLTYALGDPAMAWVPPIEQTVMNVAIAPFIAAGSSILAEHHALIVTPTATKGSTTMTIGSGSPQALSGGAWTDNPASGYSFYSLQMTQEASTYYFENAAGLTVMGYGLGSAESYYYLAASSARQLNPAFYINEIHFEDANGQTYCNGSFDIRGVAQLQLASGPGAITWYVDGVEQESARDQLEWTIPSLTLDTPHEITMIVKDVYNQVFTLTTTLTAVDPQSLQITGSRYICPPATSTVLTAESGPARYQWYKDGTEILGATQNTYTVTSANAGNYSVIGYYGTCVSPMSDTLTVINSCEPLLKVTYDGNGNTDGTAPEDENIYNDDDNVTVKALGDLVRTDALFIGWSFTASGLVTTASEVPATLMAAGDLFKITADTTLYAVWAADVNGPAGPADDNGNGGGDGIPDYLQKSVTYDGNSQSSGNAPVDSCIYNAGSDVTVKAHGTLVKTGATFIGWSFNKLTAVVATKAGEPADLMKANDVFKITTDTTLYAVWAADVNGPDGPDDGNGNGGGDGIPDYLQKSVTYDGNSPSSGNAPVDSCIYNAGSDVTVKAHGTLVKTGATFIGWSFSKLTAVVTTKAGEPADLMKANDVFKITADTTLYAVWAIDVTGPGGGGGDGIPDYLQSGVTYHGNTYTGGAVPTDANRYNYNSDVTVLGNTGNLVKTDAAFIGWSFSQVGVVTTKADEPVDLMASGNKFKMVTADTTLYAVWAEDKTGPGGGGDSIPDYLQFKVSYNGNGASGTEPTDGNLYNAGNNVTIKVHGTLVRTGATFIGWSFAAHGIVTTAANVPADLLKADSTFTIYSDTTLYAVWGEDVNGPGGPDGGGDGTPDYLQFSVTYNGNGNTGGTAPIDNNIYSSGTLVFAKDSGTLVRTGGTDPIVFAGWAPTKVSAVLTIADAASLPADFVRSGSTFTITGNTIMYAVWSTDKNNNGTPDIFETGYTVTYNGNGHTSGTEPDSAMYISGTTVTTEAHGTLAKTDAIFIGWSFAPESLVIKGNSAPAGLMAEISTFTITGNTTLYAVWAADTNGPDGGSDNVADYLQFAVTYDVNGATGTTPVDGNLYNTGNSVTLLDTVGLTRTKAVCIGWSPSKVVSDIATQVQEDALTIKQPGNIFTITSDTTWHAVWALDANGNRIPDYKEVYITYNKGILTAATGLPKTEIVEKNVSFMITNMGAKGTNYVLIGWNINIVPLVTTAAMETYAMTTGAFYAVGSLLAPLGDMVLYAVWALDKNNDGVPDYDSKIIKPTASGVSTHGLMSADDATGNEAISSAHVWAHGSTLYINSDKAVRAGIYTIGGMLYKQIDVPEGMTSEPLDRGVYIVNIDGERHKVVVK